MRTNLTSLTRSAAIVPFVGSLALLVCAPLVLPGCGDDAPKPDPAAGRRSEAVKATGPAATTPAPTQKPAPKPAPRKLCDVPPAAAGRQLPAAKVESVAAAGAPNIGDRVTNMNGRWTWVNLWATWCGPCKEEIPRLRSWEAKLNGQFSLGFVSLDDDRRMVQKFVDEQPANGMKATWWLADGKPRSSWMEAVRVPESATLPVHILVDPQGAIRCVINGAIEDADFAQVQALVAKR